MSVRVQARRAEMRSRARRCVDGLRILQTVFLLHKREEEIAVFVASFFLAKVMSA